MDHGPTRNHGYEHDSDYCLSLIPTFFRIKDGGNNRRGAILLVSYSKGSTIYSDLFC